MEMHSAPQSHSHFGLKCIWRPKRISISARKCIWRENGQAYRAKRIFIWARKCTWRVYCQIYRAEFIFISAWDDSGAPSAFSILARKCIVLANRIFILVWKCIWRPSRICILVWNASVAPIAFPFWRESAFLRENGQFYRPQVHFHLAAKILLAQK